MPAFGLLALFCVAEAANRPRLYLYAELLRAMVSWLVADHLLKTELFKKSTARFISAESHCLPSTASARRNAGRHVRSAGSFHHACHRARAHSTGSKNRL